MPAHPAADRPVGAATIPGPGARAVVLATTARAATRSAVLWGYVFGAFVASSAWSYTGIYRTQAQRVGLEAAFGRDAAVLALFGPAPGLQTVGGFTAFKVSMTVMVLGAVWGVLTGTRLLRGQEDTGRWDVLLAGRTTRRGATTQALGGMAVAVAALWALTSLISVVAGQSSRVDIAPGPALFLALALACPAAMFLAVGAATSQLAPTRRQAATLGIAVLGVSYGLRMVGDAGIGLHWLVWLSPLGWVEGLHPLTATSPWPLLPVGAFTVVVGAGAVRLAGSRDVGASVIPDRPVRVADLRWLGSPARLGLRVTGGVAAGWTATLAVIGLLFGAVARQAGATLSGSSLTQTFTRLGATGGGVRAYLGISFLIVAVLVGVVAAGQIGAARDEEAEGRLDHLLARPVSRVGWLTGRLAPALALVVVTGLVAGLAAWAGAAAQHTGVGLGSLVASGGNAVAPAVCLLGLGVLLLGLRPRAAVAGVYTVLVWSLLVELVGGIGDLGHWLLDTSVFQRVASVPAGPVDWVADGVLVAVGAVAAVVGLLAFRRRDLVHA